jgi:MFS-type transporter involved in bile tolerance (Atg22 family)
MNKTRLISLGIVISIWTTLFTLILIPGLGSPPTVKQVLVIIGIAALFAVIFEFFRPLRGKN